MGKYVPPVGEAEGAAYVDESPALGRDGSAVPAAAIEWPQRELDHLIRVALLTPDPGDLTQVTQAIARMIAAAMVPAPTLGLATPAMVQAGTDNETAITPAALRGAMPATLAATGGATWPNGLTFKWGTGQTTSSGSNISFDLAFKQECYSVYVNDGSYSTIDSFSTETIYPSYFQVKSSSPSQVGFRWFAIGK